MLVDIGSPSLALATVGVLALLLATFVHLAAKTDIDRMTEMAEVKCDEEHVRLPSHSQRECECVQWRGGPGFLALALEGHASSHSHSRSHSPSHSLGVL